jgi:hypothetical protein
VVLEEMMLQEQQVQLTLEAVEEVQVMALLQLLLQEQVVQVSWSRERLQVKELYYKQVQDVQDHL